MFTVSIWGGYILAVFFSVYKIAAGKTEYGTKLPFRYKFSTALFPVRHLSSF